MVSIADHEQIYIVPLHRSITKQSGTPGCEYVLRGLREEEVVKWSEFCASVFSYKKNPPPSEYFYRHYANDPSTKVEGSSKMIRVALYKDQIVASCRIFWRDVSGSGSVGEIDVGDGDGIDRFSVHPSQSRLRSLRCGGIGEVCTAPDHRRRGLSTELLKNAIAIMEDTPLEISSLHAAPEFFPLYESLGYSPPPLSNPSGGNRWSTVDFSWTKHTMPGDVFGYGQSNINVHGNIVQHDTSKNTNTTSTHRKLQIRRVEWKSPGSTDTETLQQLHAKYSEERFTGCVRRSSDYWNDYLSKELEDSLFVLESVDDEETQTREQTQKQILAWMSLKPSNSDGGGGGDSCPCFCIQEFGMNTFLLPNHPQQQKYHQQHECEGEGECESEPRSLSTGFVVGALAALAIGESKASVLPSRHTQHKTDTEREPRTKVELRLPGFLKDEIRACEGKTNNNAIITTTANNGEMAFSFDWASERTEIDRGWMYRDLGTGSNAARDFLGFLQGSSDSGEGDQPQQQQPSREHFVWPSDSF